MAERLTLIKAIRKIGIISQISIAAFDMYCELLVAIF